MLPIPATKVLIEQEWLECAGFVRDQLSKRLECKCRIERLRAEFARDLFWIMHEIDAAKLARIVEAKHVTVVEREHKMRMFVAWRPFLQYVQSPTHFQVDE